MKKVMAFLEKYAEWVAMGFACVFLLYMVYSYVVSPDAVKVEVGRELLMPGEVDPYINTKDIAALQAAMDDKNGDVSFPVPDFAKAFSLAMGPDRDRMKGEFVLGSVFRPAIPGEKSGETPVSPGIVPIDRLPDLAAPIYTAFNKGGSSVAIPAPLIAGAAPPAVAAAAERMDKNWVMYECKFDTKAVAAEWKKVFFDAKGQPLVPEQVLLTHFLKFEMERQEQTGPDQWGPAIQVPALALVEMKEYPKEGDREGQEEYRLWAEKHQVDIVEPSFYQVLRGDEWFVPSLKAKDKAATPADPTAAKEPFDPANPPNRTLTPEERQKVYLYNLKQKEEKQKLEGAGRKSRLDATQKPTAPSGGGERGGGGRRIGGYAPLPEQYADDRIPGQRYDDGGRPIGPAPRGRPSFQREGGRRAPERVAPGRYDNPMPTYNPTDGAIQNPALAGPFDPTKLTNEKGEPADIIMWAHDDTVVPGKTYRYRVRVMIKNPLYNTQGLTKNPKFEAQLAIASAWSGWTEITAPSNTEFYFARAVAPINGKGTINSVTVDVFKHEKGDWFQGTFQVGPGDSIGRTNNKIDFTTGMTLVDIRPDTREKDLKILVADELGNIRVISFQAQLVDPLYTSLKEKVKATAAAGPAAAAGNPALINEVGGR